MGWPTIADDCEFDEAKGDATFRASTAVLFIPAWTDRKSKTVRRRIHTKASLSSAASPRMIPKAAIADEPMNDVSLSIRPDIASKASLSPTVSPGAMPSDAPTLEPRNVASALLMLSKANIASSKLTFSHALRMAITLKASVIVTF